MVRTLTVAAALSLMPMTAFAQTIAGGDRHTIVLKSDGTVWAFGLNDSGQLGDNTTTARTAPIQVSGLSGIVAVAAGASHSMALTSTGNLYVWGLNSAGQIGDATTTSPRKTPVQSNLTNVVAIDAGAYHSVALTSSGDVYTWGKNASGQLGNGTTTASTTPVLVMTGVAAIGAGFDHTLFVKTNGTVFASGSNAYGQLGDGTTTSPRSTPVQMSGITTATAATGGELHSVILLSDGTLKATGYNGYGTIGDGTTTQRTTAVAVSTLTNITAIAAGANHVIARESDGTAWTWGNNYDGQIGNGIPFTSRTSPFEIAGLSSITNVGAGRDHTMAVTSSGVVYTWGDNSGWQLGDGSGVDRSLPTAISDPGYDWRVSTPPLNISAGTYNTDRSVVIAITTPGATIRYTQNGNEPSESDTAITSGSSVTVSTSQTLKAKAFKSGMAASTTAAATYEMKVATIAYAPNSGTYASAQAVTMSSATPGTTIRYTTDGSTPTESSTVYSSPISIATMTTLKAVGFKSNWTSSILTTGTYTMNFGTRSPWRASLLANAGTLYAKEGYFSRAAAYWTHAWELTRDGGDTGSRAIADYALGESLQQMIGFGQVDQVAARLAEIDGRDVRGTAATKVSFAREGLALLTTHHEMATFSGPEALKMYLTVAPVRALETSVRTIAAYHPSMAGTSLADLRALARSAGLELDMVHAAPVGEIPVPSVVHLRSEHYSAVIGEQDGAYILRDPGLGGTFVMSGAALRNEASGYFLVSPAVAASMIARRVSEGEAASVLGHCTPGAPASGDPPCPSCGGPGPGPGGMPSYTFHPNKVSLLLEDVPLGYTPAVGPAINLHLSYDHRDGRQPQTLDYGHVGRVWSHNWLSFVTDNLYQILPPYASETVMLRGHGHETYAGGATPTHQISRAALVKVSNDPPRFERRLPDGTVEVFTQPDRAATQLGRRTFLTQVVDAQGHAVSLTYDSTLRLVAITDALGQVTTLDYLDAADPLRITRVTDPFGRVATFTYDPQGRLETLTDVAGMTSRLSYGAADFVASMTTPYGTTTFRHEPVASTTSNFRRIEATDPAGGTERLEFHHQHTAIAATAPASEVPAGFSASNAALHLYNSLYWDKPAMAAGGGSLSTAVITSWMLASDLPGGHAWSRNVPHSVKRPLESRVWYRYPDQGAASHHSLGTGTAPALIGRVLDNGASQITQTTYNTKGMMTSKIDPAGRQTNYTYATNGIDQLTVEQVRSGGTDVLQTYAGYNSRHLPETITDAAGQTTTMTYNAAGQPLTVTNAKNETTTYTYQTGTGSLLSVTGPVSGATTSYTYDAYGRVESVADSDGYAVISDYDNLNRLIARTYPDDTTETLTYSRLDLTEQKDRLGRITRHLYDGFGRRIATRDPAGRTISQIWCPCGSMEALVDANGNRTKWERDVQGRVTREVRADNTTDTLSTYDLSGRLKTVTDPKDQVTTHSYNVDDSLSGTAYTNDVIETPNVSYTYDPYYARVATMVDGIGTTTYAYKAAGANGAGQVASVDGPLSNDTITYTYDELGRVTERAINGAANTVTWAFDTLGRVTSEVNVLGAFTYTYDGVTSRLATVAYPNSQTSTYSYLNNLGDHRLQTIHHKYPNASTLSKFDYTYDTVGNILTWRQQADTTAVMWEYGYDPADQLVSAVKKSTATPATILQRFAYGYDPGGNRTIEQNDDAVTLSAYDNLNRLMNQAPGGPMMIDGSLNEPGTVTISGVRAIVDANNNFRGTVPTATGTNTFTIVAKDATGNATTQQYEVDVAGTGKTFSYDANGNLTSDGSRAFEWNALNQVVAAEAGSHRTEYSYDAQRRRVLEIDKIAGVTTRTVREVWCEMAICEDRGFDGQTVSRNLFPLGEREGLNSRYHAPTHLGAPAAVSDDDAAIISRYAFGPWGRRTLETGSDVTERGSGGHKILDNASISLSVHRAYDFETERWLSEDPAGMIDGPNLYSYVSNQPIGRIDPSGLCGCGDECPSGEWKLHTIGFEGGAPGLTFMAGAGVLACNGKSVMKTVKVFCSTMGLYVSAGISVSWQFRGASLTDTCNRSDIKEFKTVARVSTSGTLSLSGGHKDPNTVGLTLGPGSLGAGMSVCRVVPW